MEFQGAGGEGCEMTKMGGAVDMVGFFLRGTLTWPCPMLACQKWNEHSLTRILENKFVLILFSIHGNNPN